LLAPSSASPLLFCPSEEVSTEQSHPRPGSGGCWCSILALPLRR